MPHTDDATAPPNPVASPTIRAAMARALALAARGPRTGGNPRVGCVILTPDGQTLATGYHRGAGTAHAEVDALSKLPGGGARVATAVVTLEPCRHRGRTGPCTEVLLAAGVARVVYAIDDPGEQSSGGGDMLSAAGVEVHRGVLAERAERLNRDWLASVRLGRPHVTLKLATSLDGRLAAADGTSRWITGPEARAHAHRVRARVDAILVGTGTALADRPSLTARAADGTLLGHQPIPVVLGDRALAEDAPLARPERGTILLPRMPPAEALARLAERGIRSVLVEGGAAVASAFLAAGVVDRVLWYQAPTLIGGPAVAVGDLGVATIAQAARLTLTETRRLGDDLLVVAETTPTIPRKKVH